MRKDVMKKIDKYVEAFSKDAKKGLEDGIQKLTDLYCKKVRVWLVCESLGAWKFGWLVQNVTQAPRVSTAPVSAQAACACVGQDCAVAYWQP